MGLTQGPIVWRGFLLSSLRFFVFFSEISLVDWSGNIPMKNLWMDFNMDQNNRSTNHSTLSSSWILVSKNKEVFGPVVWE